MWRRFKELTIVDAACKFAPSQGGKTMTHEMRNAEAAETKRAYKRPTLLHFGTLRQITLAVGNSKNKDGGTVKNQTKTQV
jgi:hypothetical protein